MATNLISLVMQFLSPDMVHRIAAALGLDRNKVQSVIYGAVPALLAAFNYTATQPGGAQQVGSMRVLAGTQDLCAIAKPGNWEDPKCLRLA
jgi:hypothetical protein